MPRLAKEISAAASAVPWLRLLRHGAWARQVEPVYTRAAEKEVGDMRLLTRSDFDGLICAVLLKEAGVMDEWVFEIGRAHV